MTGVEIREALKRKGITNGAMLAEHLKAPAVIYFVRGQQDEGQRTDVPVGWWNARAVLKYRNKRGYESKKTFRPEGVVDFGQQVRTQLLEDAKAYASRELGVESWARAPFSNCWLPADLVSALHAEFDGVTTGS